jgi:N-acetylneuraminate synthase
VVLGASIIEKHVTLDRNGGGPDDSFSLESEELKQLCLGTKTAWEALGNVDYGRKSSEQANVQFRRSLYIIKDIKEGEIITAEHVKSIRPGFGLPPKYLESILGQVCKKDARRGDAVKSDIF